jgi:CheY-like chemotaxis protein
MAAILIIDDDEAVRNVLSQFLGDAGHSVVEARDGKEGLKLFQSIGADILITDMVMPEIEGCAVLMALRTRNPTVKTIAISGGQWQRAGDLLHVAKLLGASKVLSKPISREDLLAAVNDLLAEAREPSALLDNSGSLAPH